eukprot:5885090-Prymnesium_polylepis.1
MTQLQRLGVHLLVLELQLPPPLMRPAWAAERKAWRAAVIQGASPTEGSANALARLLGQMEDNVRAACPSDRHSPATHPPLSIVRSLSSCHTPPSHPRTLPQLSQLLFKRGWAPREASSAEPVRIDTPTLEGADEGAAAEGTAAEVEAGAGAPKAPEVVETEEGELLELVPSSRAASGYKGVFQLRRGFEAQLRGTSLGVFETAREAAIAYARE